MKIASITITHHSLPLDPPFHSSWDTKPRTAHPATIVRVATDEGLVGIGSGDSMLGFAGHEQLFIGQDPLAIERHFRVLENLNFLYGRCWPLDLALWDLAGKIAGQPVWKLLGGLSDRVRAYASSGTLRSAEETADMAERVAARGFEALKIRFYRSDWCDDVAVIEKVRERVGDRLVLMVDCNQGWRMSWDTESPWTFKDALVHRLHNNFTAPDLLEDGLDGGRPDERPGVVVVGLEELPDGGHEVGHAVKDAAAQGLFGELAKPALDEVQPGAARGGEVQMEARVLGEPGSDGCVFVGLVVVEDQMQLELAGKLAVQRA